ncbi:ComF family protein [Anaeromyxobacter dehalogenans]|uniref:Phosphoribosyltransferase n=1 Tax=Anaeromyxobacter dehalogenans (strain 2CP-C) TaxID=290397 RepID=Q2IMH8_ANADE|nr:double zinc ribbon domain-containing protein [Anaeromyxobacter dehalogenans]ABC80013.1 phosphoribosyltransferase [Anaeromyxobacter dehalogenans 2CP-C]
MLRAAVRALLDLVYPPRCAACGEPVAEEPFCEVCAGALEPVPPGCARCGAPGAGPACGACLAAPPAFDAVRAGGLFGGPLADAVHALKYGGRPDLARPLGAWLAARVPLPPGAAVVSVPLGRARRVDRGYDQAALLADALARAAGARGRRLRGALRRARETSPQVGLGRAERARNVAGAFLAGPAVAGRDLVLVDDVVTTGATADAAARALRAAGARSVTVVALARAE